MMRYLNQKFHPYQYEVYRDSFETPIFNSTGKAIVQGSCTNTARTPSFNKRSSSRFIPTFPAYALFRRYVENVRPRTSTNSYSLCMQVQNALKCTKNHHVIVAAHYFYHVCLERNSRISLYFVYKNVSLFVLE